MKPTRRKLLQAIGLAPLAPRVMLAAAPAWRLGKVAIGHHGVLFECLEHGGRKFLASICLSTGAPAMEFGGLCFMPYAAYTALRREVGL